ncbi:tRNA (adenosine(37)-N6)-threonylcarbamoyltransferase complex ATPase subunit type 1 TsaE [Lacticaseibacillus mingshuiensis]|uniref:tRNA threonylcarbamoyladenosine biosynthesis protein TsaE n=1 Tax=Lacticaseibacillus mingshuiensis TaxID=2799574 RepID=A0ABW4CFV6_9LACO|nr:tRNA (adenosine(37)-N6)-threonylcarbamoyltransferase complex ATPase subunit type 1 TsaE [Lacticaseibacillus mingshuiensis]
MRTTFANEAALQTFAAKIAPFLQAGDVLLLEGDLGAGKTSFTKGLAKGLGISQNVKSPTFTIIREYPDGRLPLYHMDIYRLEDGGVEDLGLEEYFDGDGVSVVEWPQFLGVVAPSDALTIRLDKDPLVDEQRQLTISATGPRATALAAQIKALK